MEYQIKLNNLILTLLSNGNALSFTNSSGKNYIFATPFMVVYDELKNEYTPKSLSVENNLITVNFSNGVIVKVNVNGYQDFLTFTLQEVVGNPYSVKFVNLRANIDYDSEENNQNAYSLGLMSMTMATRMYEHPGKNEVLIAEAYKKTGFNGNNRSPYNPKCAVILCKNSDISSVQNKVLDLIPNGELIKSSLGGPNAKNALKSAKKTYTLHWTPITDDNYQETVNYFKEAGIEQINLHFMEQYSQGSFNVNSKCYPNGISDYKKIVNRLHNDGFEVGLHCYVFFVAPTDSYITPIPNDDIDVLNEFTLKNDISNSDTELFTVETLDGVSEKTYYVVNNSNTIRIDNELIKFNGVDKNGKLLNLERGALGTTVSAHKKGAKIKQYKEYFFHYLAKWGSPLFYQIAKNTAKFYNEVGFDCVYFDALDGAACLEGEDFVWYTAIDFIREFWNNIDHDAVFNCCHNMQYTSTWFARSRYGALDKPKASYQEYKDAHLNYNKQVSRRMGVNEELGWFDLYPSGTRENFYYQFMPVRKEDIAYIYGKCMGTDACCTFLECLPKKRQLPVMKEHYKTVREYQNYKNTHVLTNASREYFNSENSGCLIDNGTLKKASFKVYRQEHINSKITIENIYKKQKPFIRLEGLYQADDYDNGGIRISGKISLKNGDFENILFDKPIDATKNRGVGVLVKGDGKGGRITISIRSFSGNAPRWINYYIYNDFVGYKYFKEVELHTGDDRSVAIKKMDNSTYTALQEFYGYYFGVLDYSAVEGIDISYQGDGFVEIEPIKFLPAIKSQIVNPTIKIGDKEIKVNGTISSTQTLEIETDGSARIIDTEFNVLDTPTIIGEIPDIESGKTTFEVIGENNTFTRLRVTIGLIGEELQ